MIDTVSFENEYGDHLNPWQYGIWLKYFIASPPKPKIYRFELDGMDGALDLTEWAGETKYESRTVKIGLRDMDSAFYQMITNFCHGRMVKILHSADLNHYFYGRGESEERSTNLRVMDCDLEFTCEPYKLSRLLTEKSATITGTGDVVLRAQRMSAIPKITLSAPCTLTYGGEEYTLAAGTHTVNGIVIKDRPQTLSITTESSADVKIIWRDGVL